MTILEIGTILNVSLQPYHAGIARVKEVRPSHEYGRPDRPSLNHTTIVVEAIEMTTTSRLFGATSVRPVDVGTEFELHFHNCEIPRIVRTGRADYAYGV